MKRVLMSMMLVITGVSFAQDQLSAEDRIMFEQVHVQLIDALGFWKQEAVHDTELLGLLERVKDRLCSEPLSLEEHILYSILLTRVHTIDSTTNQKQVLHHLMSQSTQEIMQQCAVIIQAIRNQKK